MLIRPSLWVPLTPPADLLRAGEVRVCWIWGRMDDTWM